MTKNKTLLEEHLGFTACQLQLASLEQLKCFSHEELQRQVSSARKHARHSGTTIIALRYKKGVVMAADRQTTYARHLVFGENTKISEIPDGYSIMGMAGLVGCIQELWDTFDNAFNALKRFIEAPIYVDGQASLMKYILRANSDNLGILMYILDYTAHPILAGWDPQEKESRIFQFDEYGSTYEATSPGFTVVGSGTDFAKTTLANFWGEGLSATDAIRLAVRALFYAGTNDVWTATTTLVPPDVMLASDAGIQRLGVESALALTHEVLGDQLERYGDTKRLGFFFPEPEESK